MGGSAAAAGGGAGIASTLFRNSRNAGAASKPPARSSPVGQAWSRPLISRTARAAPGAHVVKKRVVAGPYDPAAAGSPGLITAEMVKPGAAVLDAGVSRVDGKLRGDVAPEVAEVAGYLSPNPGGVGPMTRAMLLTNVVEAAERDAQQGR